MDVGWGLSLTPPNTSETDLIPFVRDMKFDLTSSPPPSKPHPTTSSGAGGTMSWSAAAAVDGTEETSGGEERRCQGQRGDTADQ